jgi:hypothetical protein
MRLITKPRGPDEGDSQEVASPPPGPPKTKATSKGTFATGMGRLRLPAQRLARGSFAEGMMRAHDRVVLHQGSFAEGLAEPEAA